MKACSSFTNFMTTIHSYSYKKLVGHGILQYQQLLAVIIQGRGGRLQSQYRNHMQRRKVNLQFKKNLYSHFCRVGGPQGVLYRKMVEKFEKNSLVLAGVRGHALSSPSGILYQKSREGTYHTYLFNFRTFSYGAQFLSTPSPTDLISIPRILLRRFKN